MSSTRHAEPGSPLRPERWASSPKYKEGMPLPGHLVAKRCAAVQMDAADKELIWFVQYRSWQDGLPALAAQLLAIAGGRVGTRSMRELGAEPGRIYTADEVRRIRKELPVSEREHFLLRGEFSELEEREMDQLNDPGLIGYRDDEAAREITELTALSAARTDSYPAEDFVRLCLSAANVELPEYLKQLCCDPAVQMDTADPWYFAGLVDALRAERDRWMRAAQQDRAETTNGERIRETLAYLEQAPCLPNEGRPMALCYGGSGWGKSFEARAACQERPGRRRYFAVPPGNEDKPFYLELNKSLGCLQNVHEKAGELKLRSELALDGGDITLVVDDSHRLWPQSNLRDNMPKRVEWFMKLAERGVPICFIAGQQFFDSQGLAEARMHWNSLQLENRLRHVVDLAPPTAEDIRCVAGALFPGADAVALDAVVSIAALSLCPLATVGSIAQRATHEAGTGRIPGPEHVAAGITYALGSNKALAKAVASRRGKTKRRVENTTPPGFRDAPADTPRELRDPGVTEDLAGMIAATGSRTSNPSRHLAHVVTVPG